MYKLHLVSAEQRHSLAHNQSLCWHIMDRDHTLSSMAGQSTLRHKYDIDISDEDLRLRRMELRYYEQAALERSSRASQQSVERCYETFCRSVRLSPFPLSYETVGLFLVQYCQRFGHTTRSIPTILSHLRRAARERGYYVPLSEADAYRLADVIRGLQKHDRSAPQRKLPITHQVLLAMQAKANMRNLRHFQCITMCRVAHDALLRGSELESLLSGCLSWSTDRSQVTITIHLSKANKSGPPEKVTLSDYGPASAVAMLRQYVDLMGFPFLPATLPLWPRIEHTGVVTWATATSKDQFVALVRTLLHEAGYPPALYSGHSFRSGGATDLWASNSCRPQTIKLFGRWKSEAFWLYIRDNPQLRAIEVANAFAAIHRGHRPDISVKAATALASFQFGKGGISRLPL